MTSPRHEAAFLTALGHLKIRDILWPEGTLALVVGVGGTLALHHFVSLSVRISTVGDSLAMIGTLLGVVFAAFALLIALFSDAYVNLLQKAEGGIKSFLRPFIVAVGLQVTTLIVAIAYRAVAQRVPRTTEFILFVVWGFLFIYVLTDIVALTRNVMMHGLTRAAQISQTRPDDNVRTLRDKSSG